MPSKFDFEDCKVEAFCVAYGAGSDEMHLAVPLEPDVQELLVDALIETYAGLTGLKGEDEWSEFEVSENPKGVSALRAETNDEVFARIRTIFEMAGRNVSIEEFGKRLGEISYYYAIFRDGSERRVIGFRQARRIRASVKARYVLISESLRLVREKVFHLDPQFDFIVGRSEILALSAHSLESIAGIEQFLKEKYQERAKALARSVPQVDWSAIAKYANDRTRAQRLLIALSRRRDLKNLNPKLLGSVLTANKCQFTHVNNCFAPKPNFEMSFLEVLEGRRWPHDITGGGPILYRASNRSVVQG